MVVDAQSSSKEVVDLSGPLSGQVCFMYSSGEAAWTLLR